MGCYKSRHVTKQDMLVFEYLPMLKSKNNMDCGSPLVDSLVDLQVDSTYLSSIRI